MTFNIDFIKEYYGCYIETIYPFKDVCQIVKLISSDLLHLDLVEGLQDAGDEIIKNGIITVSHFP